MCDTCALLAIEPAIANTGDTITLEGTFIDGAVVQFPGGATATASILGAHRATAVVPAGATAGDLTVSIGTTTVGPVTFRRASFQLGLSMFQQYEDQTDSARQMSALVTNRSCASVLVAHDSVYLIGGSSSSGDQSTVEHARLNADGSIGQFEASPVALTAPRALGHHIGIAVNGYFYVVGGINSTGPLGSIERAPIQADGTLGAFAIVPGVQLVRPRYNHAVAVIGASLVVVGGSSAVSPYFLDSVEAAPIHADGSLGPFAEVGHLGTAREAHAIAVVGGSLYVVGGDATAGGIPAIGSIERAPILGDGTIGAFSPAGQLAAVRQSHTVWQLGSKVFVSGGSGASGESITSIEVATVQPSGDLGSFSIVATNAMPHGSQCASPVITSRFAYVIGGASGPAAMRAPLDASGNLASAAKLASPKLVIARVGASVAVIGGFAYVIGGVDSAGSLVSTVERATIGKDGTLGVFAVVPGVSLVAKRRHAAIATIGNWLYVLGGINATGARITNIERASIASDGSISTFAAAGSLATARGFASSIVVGGYLYVIAGGDACCGGFLSSVERATINSDGSLGTFANQAGTLVQAHAGPAIAVSNGYLYVMGGASASTVYSSFVERAAINSDGSLGTFAASAGGNLTKNRQDATSSVIGHFLYVVGGINQTGRLTDVERATIAADGTLGAFATVAGTTLTAGRTSHASLPVGNTLYLLGGDTGTATDSIEQALLP